MLTSTIIFLSVFMFIGILFYLLKPNKELLDRISYPGDWTPLSFAFSNELITEHPELDKILNSSVSWWFEQTGKRYVATLEEMIEGGNVVAIMKASRDNMDTPSRETYAYVRPRITPLGYISSAGVYVTDKFLEADMETQLYVLRHEIGHCLGLSHDEEEDSIMNNKTINPNFQVSRMDKELLQTLYPDIV